MIRPVLKIYVDAYCFTCQETYRLAAAIAPRAPELTIDMVDIDQADAVIPPEVFATPTYLLNGRVISLGNPTLERLCQALREAGVAVAEPIDHGRP